MIPLPWERLFWSSAPGFPTSARHPRTVYVLTDFRVVICRGDVTCQEMALADIASVRLEQSWLQRLTAHSTVRIQSRRPGQSMVLADVGQGPQLALVLQMLAADRVAGVEDFVRSALGPDAPRLLHPHHGVLVVAALAFALAFVAIGVSRRDTLAPIAYGADDPIAPDGHRRSTAEIVAFMEHEVMPFATRALAPLVGGASNVTCHTCHGVDAVRRQWKMPGVRALPEPEVRFAGMERSGYWLDPQMRNAVYGYLAEDDKLPTAAYMRGVVMPGMARVMRRPAYDFTKTYGFNRAHVAVGCYHCHLVE